MGCLYGSLCGLRACLRGNWKPSFSFVICEWVNRRLAQSSPSCSQNTDDSCAYTGHIEISALRFGGHGCGQKGSWRWFTLVQLIEIRDLTILVSGGPGGHKFIPSWPASLPSTTTMATDILHAQRLQVAAVVAFYMASALTVSLYLICTIYHSDSSRRWSLCAVES